jgi:hypothetical protein
MELSKLDKSVFKYPPFDPKTYKELRKLDEFAKVDCDEIPINKFIDYVILCFDFETPLRKEYPFIENQKNFNLQRKKFEAARMADFPIIDNKFEPEVEAFLLGKNKECNAAIVKYIISFGRMEYAILISYECMLLELIKASFIGVVDNKDIDKRIEFHMNKINELTNKLYGGQETIEAKEALYLSAEKDIVNFFPEGVADIMDKEGELPDEWSPYHGKISNEQIKKDKQWKGKFLGKQKPTKKRIRSMS